MNEWRLEQTMNIEELKKAFFVEVIEVRNESSKDIFVTAIKSELTGRLFIHIFEDEGFRVKPKGYRLVPIEIEKLTPKVQDKNKERVEG